MPLTKGRIARQGRIIFHDAKLSIWEEGILEARNVGGWDGANRWERQFKRDVFTRIIQTLRRLGWTVSPQTYIRTGNNARYCRKGDLQADLHISGRCIEFDMFQSVNTPDRSDNGGRYQYNKEKHMPYLVRLEMERTRCRIRDYLCNVFTEYEFKSKEVKSPNPDPLAYFNDDWDDEYVKKRGTHRFERGPDGWPSDKEVSSWNRHDKDGVALHHGDVRYARDVKGRLQRGRVYGGINGMWLFIYGPGARDYTSRSAKAFFTYRPAEMPKKLTDSTERRKRIERELTKAIEAMNFERAATLRDILHPAGFKQAA